MISGLSVKKKNASALFLVRLSRRHSGLAQSVRSLLGAFDDPGQGILPGSFVIGGNKTLAFGAKYQPFQLVKLVPEPLSLCFEADQLLVFRLRYCYCCVHFHDVNIPIKTIDNIGVTCDLPTKFCY